MKPLVFLLANCLYLCSFAVLGGDSFDAGSPALYHPLESCGGCGSNGKSEGMQEPDLTVLSESSDDDAPTVFYTEPDPTWSDYRYSPKTLEEMASGKHVTAPMPPLVESSYCLFSRLYMQQGDAQIDSLTVNAIDKLRDESGAFDELRLRPELTDETLRKIIRDNSHYVHGRWPKRDGTAFCLDVSPEGVKKVESSITQIFADDAVWSTVILNELVCSIDWLCGSGRLKKPVATINRLMANG